jgi:hypothetical protein
MISLRELIGGSHYHAIPDMQRDYQWDIDRGKKHGRYLWDNIVEFTEEDPDKKDSYYIGTMITYKEGTKWMVIDGQQRLTTISILFMAARDILDTAYSGGLRGDLTLNSQAVPLKKCGRVLAADTIGTPNRPRLVPKASSQTNYKAFMAYIHPVDNRPSFRKKYKTKIRVVQAYEMFHNELTRMFATDDMIELQKMVGLLDHILDGVVITRTIVKDLAHGYRIFSTENTTGLKLGNLDIVRALILAQVDRKKLNDYLDAVQGNLAKMMENLDGLDKREKQDFIRHLWIVMYGTPMGRTKLANSISKDIGNLKSGPEAISYTKILSKAAGNYSKKVVGCRPSQLYYRAHRDLKDCGFKQYRPLLLALSARKDISKEAYTTIFGIIETMYVRFLLVGKQKGSLLEPTFASWSKQAADWSLSESDLILKWGSDASSIKETFNFKAAFEFMRVTAKNPKKYRYILSLIEEYSDPGVEKKLLGAAVAEPILPVVKDPEEWKVAWDQFNETDHAEGLHHSVGNYVLLRAPSKLAITDGWLARADHYEKKGRFRGTREFAENAPDYDPRIVKQRAGKLAEKASHIWNIDKYIKSP